MIRTAPVWCGGMGAITGHQLESRPSVAFVSHFRQLYSCFLLVQEMDWATRVLVWEEEDGEEGLEGGGAAAKEANAGKQGKGPKPEKGGKRK